MPYVSLFHYHQAELDALREYQGTEREGEPIDYNELVIRAGCKAYGADFALSEIPARARDVADRETRPSGRCSTLSRSDGGPDGVFHRGRPDGSLRSLRADWRNDGGRWARRGGSATARILETCSVIPYKVWMDMPLADAFAASEALEPFFRHRVTGLAGERDDHAGVDGLPVDDDGNLWLGDEGGFLILAAVLTSPDVQPVMTMAEMKVERIGFLVKAYNMNAAAIHSRKEMHEEGTTPADPALSLLNMMGGCIASNPATPQCLKNNQVNISIGC